MTTARVEALEALVATQRVQLERSTQGCPQHNQTFTEENLTTLENLRGFLTAALPKVQEPKLRPSDKDTVFLLRVFNTTPAINELSESERLTVAGIARRHLVGSNFNYRAAQVDFYEHSL